MNEPEDIFSLKAALDSQSIEIEELQEEIERLRTERDEARRLVCELAVAFEAEMFHPQINRFVPKTQKDLAKAYKWDCFKKGK